MGEYTTHILLQQQDLALLHTETSGFLDDQCYQVH